MASRSDLRRNRIGHAKGMAPQGGRYRYSRQGRTADGTQERADVFPRLFEVN